MTEQTKSIALAEVTDLTALYTAKGEGDPLMEMVDKIVAESKGVAFDVTTVKGRKACRSYAAKIASSKVALDKAGKDLTEEDRLRIAATNAKRKELTEKLDAAKAGVLAQAIAWEEKEEARKQAHIDAMVKFDAGRVDALSCSSQTIQAVIDELSTVVIGPEWQEFQDDAEVKRRVSLDALADKLKTALDREAQEAELETLREKVAAQEALDAARIAEERKILEAKRLADETAERAKAEAERIEFAKAEAVRQAAIEAERAAEAHRNEIEAMRLKVIADQQAAEKKAADESKRKADEIAQRQADQNHRDSIMADIVAALDPIDHSDIAAAIMSGLIPHVSVNF